MSKDIHFIVSHYQFVEHPTFECANNERNRLAKVFPNKIFKVYCIIGDFDNPDCNDPKRKFKRKQFTGIKKQEKKQKTTNWKMPEKRIV